jgi:transposase
MDNNAAEQSIRGFCISKKNQVTIDTIAGAKSSAIIYSIAETAKSNHMTLFKNILKRCPMHSETA